MPTPIQSSSITNKLRSFFRLRGRQIFSLDETTVPTVQIEDLTNAPYRANHQVRWKVGQVFNTNLLAARNFLIVINTSRAAFIDLSDVPGVAVVERVEIQPAGTVAPDNGGEWLISLVNHQGVIMSVEPGAVITAIASDVDSARTVPVPSLGVEGQVPVRLSGVQENIAPNLGNLLRLGRLRALPLPANPPEPIYHALPCEQVTIGDNVALLLRNGAPSTTGFVTVNVSGSYYPLARS